jgi:hypothetical protein
VEGLSNAFIDTQLQLGDFPNVFDEPRKVRKKTVSVALSKEQFEWLSKAIENWRQAKAILKEMQQLSSQVLFTTIPNLNRRKRLGKKVLGLI